MLKTQLGVFVPTRRKIRLAGAGLQLLAAATLALAAGSNAAYSQTTIPASFAAPAGSVDLTKPGFRLKIVQGPASPTFPNTSARAEGQLNGTYLDPATSAPYPNEADLTAAGPDGYFVITNVINFTGDAGSAGNFQPDDPIPGIPGTTGSTDSIAGEFVTFLKLDPGVYTFGVNSDDGFRVTSGLNPRSSSAIELGVFEGGRGASDTLFDVVVTNSGIYPIRLIWYEGGGGANVEFFTVTASGEKILINNRTNANAVTAYLTSTLALPPIVQSVSPADGSRAARGTDNVVIRLADQTTSVVSNSIVLTFNGATVTPTISQVGGITTITYDPPGDLARASSNFVRFVFQDNATPANRFTNTFSFIVGGELTRKVYDDIGGGTAVADLTGSAKYIENQPDVVDLVSLFETPPDVANNYGAEILGYFTPTANDAYTFYLSADDGAVLYLSTDASPANRVQIAVQPSWNASREYISGNNAALRKSAPQNLIAGQRYFIHALFKEGGGGDNLAVAVRTPSNPTIVNGDAPIAGPEISPFVGVDFVVNPSSQTVLVGRPVTFRGQAISGSGGGMVYQFLRNGVPITDATNTSYTIPSVASTDNGALFSVRATAGTNVATSAAATLTVNPDATVPTITGVGALTNNLIGVCFSEVVRTAGATNPANYTVSGATVTDARLSADGKTVFLTVTPVGASYTVSAINQTDLAGNPVSSTAVPGTVNSSYINIDLGGPAEVGSAVTCGNGDFEITAGGNDIWGNADQEHFVGQLITGDFDKRVRVEYLEPVNRWSKAGLQVREDLDGDSRALTAYVSPSAVPTQDGDGGGIGNNIYEAGRRVAKAGGTDAWHTSNPPPPYPNAWIRVSRVGNVFTGYWGTNGTDWTQFARSIPAPVYPAAVYFGLALTAHNDPGDPTTAGFTADASFRSYSDIIGGPRFNQPVLDPATRNVTISWVGAGRLQESTTVNGTYTDSAVQTNPQTRTATTGFRFFRLINP